MQTEASAQIQVSTKTGHNVIFIKTEDATQIEVSMQTSALSAPMPASTQTQASVQTQTGRQIQASMLMKDFLLICGGKAPRRTKASTQTDVHAIRGSWQNL
ncbi:hypothetical protein GOODEAATRI_030070 [Goodea atripinnis]|uniref:Uncharacterized protein n=1 Tax=Goodea atripinnis TaxID=208336 RepID=A0ABV0NZB6_9TELE